MIVLVRMTGNFLCQNAHYAVTNLTMRTVGFLHCAGILLTGLQQILTSVDITLLNVKIAPSSYGLIHNLIKSITFVTRVLSRSTRIGEGSSWDLRRLWRKTERSVLWGNRDRRNYDIVSCAVKIENSGFARARTPS
jgi:hypothetical protein